MTRGWPIRDFLRVNGFFFPFKGGRDFSKGWVVWIDNEIFTIMIVEKKKKEKAGSNDHGGVSAGVDGSR